MEPSRFILKAADRLITWIVVSVLVLVGLYAIYALWDNHRIYQAAGNVQADMLQLKPDIDRPSLAELQAINPDACAWVALDNTNIDHPVLQGVDNMTYINTDIYGKFALAGSIFLDSRCDRYFRDRYSLIYGHHMDDHAMFGDMDLYKDTEFFKRNKTGVLITEDRTYDLEIFACLIVGASEDMIFEPSLWHADINQLLNYTEQKALQIRPETIEEIKQMDDPQILALSTCSYEYSDARTIILAVMTPHNPADEEEDNGKD